MRMEALSVMYRSPFFFRVRPLWEVHVRREERIAERTRIAHDLRDTVLGDFVRAFLQLQAIVDQLPLNAPTVPRLRKILELMERVIEEFRRAVRGLGSSELEPETQDLERAFSQVPRELGAEPRITFRVLVLGSPRQLDPAVRDEIYRIGREALVNAFRHAEATCIEVELEYAAKRFRLTVRDNGRGIDPQILQAGREGHWGLLGMRERAEKVGARLKVRSRAAAGTEVELSVPNRIAFESRNA